MAEKSQELQSGLYIVTSPALKPGSFIGRDCIEDHSLLPKRVVIHPPGVLAPRWIVESLGKGRYKLKVMGAPTCEIDKKLFAILIGAESEEWVVKYRTNHDAYTVEKTGEKAGWVADNEEPYQQIDVRPLVVKPSDPPQYTHNALWKFAPVDREI